MMRVLVVVSVFVTLTLCINANSADESENESNSILKQLYELLTEKEQFKTPFVQSILKSFDQECMYNKYKEQKFVKDYLTEDVLTLRSRSADVLLVLINNAFTCSSKFKPLLHFVFDSVFSFSDLFEAFRDDEPFKTYLDELICYNNYAVKHNYMDPSVYPDFEHNLVDKTDEHCDAKIQELNDLLNLVLAQNYEGFRTHNPECFKKEAHAIVETIFYKYVLLIASKITTEQKAIARENFVIDIFKSLEKLLTCSAFEKTEKNLVDGENGI